VAHREQRREHQADVEPERDHGEQRAQAHVVRAEREGLPILYLRGTPYEMGYEHGRLMKTEMEEAKNQIYRYLSRVYVHIPGLTLFIMKRIMDHTWNEMEPYVSYDEMMELSEEIISNEEGASEIKNAGITVNLSNGNVVLADVNPNIIYKLSVALDADEILELVSAIAAIDGEDGFVKKVDEAQDQLKRSEDALQAAKDNVERLEGVVKDAEAALVKGAENVNDAQAALERNRKALEDATDHLSTLTKPEFKGTEPPTLEYDLVNKKLGAQKLLHEAGGPVDADKQYDLSALELLTLAIIGIFGVWRFGAFRIARGFADARAEASKKRQAEKLQKKHAARAIPGLAKDTSQTRSIREIITQKVSSFFGNRYLTYNWAAVDTIRDAENEQEKQGRPHRVVVPNDELVAASDTARVEKDSPGLINRFFSDPIIIVLSSINEYGGTSILIGAGTPLKTRPAKSNLEPWHEQ